VTLTGDALFVNEVGRTRFWWLGEERENGQRTSMTVSSQTSALGRSRDHLSRSWCRINLRIDIAQRESAL